MKALFIPLLLLLLLLPLIVESSLNNAELNWLLRADSDGVDDDIGDDEDV